MPRQTRAQQARSEIARSIGFSKISNPGPWKEMDSSRVREARYDAGLEQIQVVFRNGDPYYYDGIPRNIWNNFRRTPSPGKFINRVLNNFPYSRSPVEWDEFDAEHEAALEEIQRNASFVAESFEG